MVMELDIFENNANDEDFLLKGCFDLINTILLIYPNMKHYVLDKNFVKEIFHSCILEIPSMDSSFKDQNSNSETII